jgi:hypothetical protein
MTAQRTSRTVAVALGLAVVAMLALIGSSVGARANGVPQLVKLEYVPGLSNFGPQNAEGVLEFSFAERYARVDVKNLVPEEGLVYEGWMINPEGHALSVGTFSIAEDGIGLLESRFDGIERYDYNRFVIAARDSSEPLGTLPQRLSIAGSFTIIDDAATPGAAPAESRPQVLPETGQLPENNLPGRILMTLGAMVATALGIIVVQKARNRGAAND